MFPGLSPMEMSLIRQDWRSMLHSPEACTVSLKFQTKLLPNNPDLDPVYRVDRGAYGDEVEVKCIPCIIQIVNERNLKILGFGIVEVGDALLYFEDTLNLEEPTPGKKPVPETLFFVDSQDVEWVPVPKDAGPLSRFLATELGNQAIVQVVPCTLKKG